MPLLSTLVGGAGGATVSPPGGVGGLALWLDAATASSLYTTSGGSTPSASDADPVGRWEDLSGNGNHYSQATSASRPTLKLSIQNSRNVVRFDGTDDYLTRAALSVGSGNFTILAACNRGGASKTIFGEGSSSSSNPMLQFGSSPGGNLLGNDRDDAGTEVSGGSFNVGADSAWHVYAFRRNGTAFRLRVDSTTGDATATISTQTVNQSAVGCLPRVANSQFYGGDLGELLVYNTNLSDADVLTVAAYLKSRWGTP